MGQSAAARGQPGICTPAPADRKPRGGSDEEVGPVLTGAERWAWGWLRHLSAQSSAGLPPGQSEPGSFCEADRFFWASLGDSPTGRGPQRR